MFMLCHSLLNINTQDSIQFIIPLPIALCTKFRVSQKSGPSVVALKENMGMLSDQCVILRICTQIDVSIAVNSINLNYY